MDKKLINEEINNIKYLFGYKPGRVISEQDIDYTTDDYLDTTEMTEDNHNLFLRRRLSTIETLIEKYIKEVEEEGTFFSDEFEFADNIISWVVQDLIGQGEYGVDYDELTDLVKDNFGEYILSQYTESHFDEDDEYEDFDFLPDEDNDHRDEMM